LLWWLAGACKGDDRAGGSDWSAGVAFGLRGDFLTLARSEPLPIKAAQMGQAASLNVVWQFGQVVIIISPWRPPPLPWHPHGIFRPARATVQTASILWLGRVAVAAPM